MIQVHETQLVRHGMMVVGESGSGKSRNIEVLAKALSTLFEEKIVDKDGFYKIVDRLILNPKRFYIFIYFCTKLNSHIFFRIYLNFLNIPINI